MPSLSATLLFMMFWGASALPSAVLPTIVAPSSVRMPHRSETKPAGQSEITDAAASKNNRDTQNREFSKCRIEERDLQNFATQVRCR